MKLLVIDIQKGITDSRLFNFEAFIDDTIRIIKAARDNQIEVIYFQHDDGPGTGFSIGDEDFEIAEQVIPREGEKIFIKNINSCFGNKDFTDYVKDDNTLMIVGLQTNFNLSINSLNFPLFSRLPAIENSIYVSFSLVFALMG